MSQIISEIPNLNLPTKLVDGVEVPVLDKPYTQVAEAIRRGGGLDMSWWHGQWDRKRAMSANFCGTVHCIAGWVTHLCGAQGIYLEREVIAIGKDKGLHYDPGIAAEMILSVSSSLPRPHFDPWSYFVDDEGYFDDSPENVNRRALEKIEALAIEEATP